MTIVNTMQYHGTIKLAYNSLVCDREPVDNRYRSLLMIAPSSNQATLTQTNVFYSRVMAVIIRLNQFTFINTDQREIPINLIFLLTL